MEQFEVIFLDENRETVLEKQLVKKGERVEYKGKKPEKEPLNNVKFIFEGWIGEEKMVSVQENLTLIAKFSEETIITDMEEALFAATLKSTENMKLNSTIEAGKKITMQEEALKRDRRTPEEIVNDILRNGKTEIGNQIEKDSFDR